MIALRDAALTYAARGWPVFPCATGGKTPLTTHGLKDASAHREHVWQWWQRWCRANIAIATGAESGLLVIDLDGLQGRESWEKLTAEHRPVSTLVAITGGLGLHLLFAYPESAELGNTAGRLGAGIDTRGHSGYIIAPPSQHALDGRTGGSAPAQRPAACGQRRRRSGALQRRAPTGWWSCSPRHGSDRPSCLRPGRAIAVPI